MGSPNYLYPVQFHDLETRGLRKDGLQVVSLLNS